MCVCVRTHCMRVYISVYSVAPQRPPRTRLSAHRHRATVTLPCDTSTCPQALIVLTACLHSPCPRSISSECDAGGYTQRAAELLAQRSHARSQCTLCATALHAVHMHATRCTRCARQFRPTPGDWAGEEWGAGVHAFAASYAMTVAQ